MPAILKYNRDRGPGEVERVHETNITIEESRYEFSDKIVVFKDKISGARVLYFNGAMTPLLKN